MNMPIASRSVLPFAFLVLTPTMAASAPQGHESEGVPEGRIEIPFEVSPRGHVLIEVAIDGHHSLPFALDTGAGMTFVNRTLLDALGLEERESEAVLQRAHGQAAMGVTEVASLSVGEAEFGALEVGTMDLTDVEGDDTTLFGVLGVDILSRFDISIDFVGQSVVLLPRAASLEACQVCQGEIAAPFTLAEGTHIQFEVSISDQPITAILDTGSGRTGMNGLAARAIGFDIPATPPGAHGPALQVGELHVGGSVLARDVIVGVVDLPAFDALGIGDGPALLIGTGALVGRRVGISYGLQRLFIE